MLAKLRGLRLSRSSRALVVAPPSLEEGGEAEQAAAGSGVEESGAEGVQSGGVQVEEEEEPVVDADADDLRAWHEAQEQAVESSPAEGDAY